MDVCGELRTIGKMPGCDFLGVVWKSLVKDLINQAILGYRIMGRRDAVNTDCESVRAAEEGSDETVLRHIKHTYMRTEEEKDLLLDLIFPPPSNVSQIMIINQEA